MLPLDFNPSPKRSSSHAFIVKVIIFAVLTVLVQITSSGKIRVDLPGVELTDYRFGLGDPYVAFYERDFYRGQVYFHVLGKTCRNLPANRQNWASSVNVFKRCITVCDESDCTGNCARIYAQPQDPNNKGATRLSKYGLNDKIKSVKFCYT